MDWGSCVSVAKTVVMTSSEKKQKDTWGATAVSRYGRQRRGGFETQSVPESKPYVWRGNVEVIGIGPERPRWVDNGKIKNIRLFETPKKRRWNTNCRNKSVRKTVYFPGGLAFSRHTDCTIIFVLHLPVEKVSRYA